MRAASLSLPWKALIVVGILAGPIICLLSLAALLTSGSWEGPLDLRIYRDITTQWRAGGDLYALIATEENYPFTYPPFAAALLYPLSLIPLNGAIIVWWAISLICLYATVRWSFRESTVPWFVVLAIAGTMTVASPVWDTLALGQINLIILALVAADFFRLPSKARGCLVGLAASIKITPAFLFLLPLLRREWGTVIRGALTIAAIAVVAGIIFPKETFEYFTSALWDTSRPGRIEWQGNQSLAGLLARVDAFSIPLWLAGCAIVVACAVFIVSMPAGQAKPTALFVVATAGLLVSPISWAHHWVWVAIAPAAVLALWQARYRAEAILTALLSAVLVFLSPFDIDSKPGATTLTSTWWLVESNLYAGAGFLWILSFAALTFSRRTKAPAVGSEKELPSLAT